MPIGISIAGVSLPGLPPLLDPIPNLAQLPNILAIPSLPSILNLSSIPQLQAVPNVLSIIKAPSIAGIASLPGVAGLLNVPNLSVLVRVPNITGLLNMVGAGGLLNFDGATSLGVAPAPVWGIFSSSTGAAVIVADSMISFEHNDASKISNFPQEEGAFQSYNKAASPYESRVRMSRGGTEVDRAIFLDQVQIAKDSLDLYDIVTPEKVYLNANIYRYELVRRASSGVSLISVDLFIEEVRVTATTQFVNSATGEVLGTGSAAVGPPAPGNVGPTISPSAALPFNLGEIQAKIPTLPQLPSPGAILNLARQSLPPFLSPLVH